MKEFKITKKLIIKYCNPTSKLDDLIYYFHKYISMNQLVSISDYEKIYSNFENTPLSIEIYDQKGNLIFVNKSISSIWKLSWQKTYRNIKGTWYQL